VEKAPIGIPLTIISASLQHLFYVKGYSQKVDGLQTSAVVCYLMTTYPVSCLSLLIDTIKISKLSETSPNISPSKSFFRSLSFTLG